MTRPVSLPLETTDHTEITIDQQDTTGHITDRRSQCRCGIQFPMILCSKDPRTDSWTNDDISNNICERILLITEPEPEPIVCFLLKQSHSFSRLDMYFAQSDRLNEAGKQI